MYEMKLIEVTGLANAAYRRDVVLPACERRAAQAQALSGVVAGRSGPGSRVLLRRWLHVRRLSWKGLVGRTRTTALPDA
jgi:hypothetical protein